MHSNDARGATITEDPTDPPTKLSASPLLVRTKGAETGVRTKIIPGFDSSLSVFMLDQDSEIVFQGDAGDTSASRASRRYGVEWTNRYRPVSWIDVDADFAYSHARFVGFDSDQAAVFESLAGFPQAQIGNAPGNYIPNAPAIVASAGITLGEKTGPFGTLRWRYLGSSPLTEDNAFRSPATSIFNGRLGYRARQRLENPARRAEPAQQPHQPDHLCLRFADQDRQPLQSLPVACARARGRVPERRDGHGPASDRAAHDPDHGGRCVLSEARSSGGLMWRNESSSAMS